MKIISQKNIFLFILFVFFHKTIVAQEKFEIDGISDIMYNNAEVTLLGKFYKKNNFTSISTKIKDGKFYLSEKLLWGYQKVYLSIQVNGKSHTYDFFIKKGKQKIIISYITENETLNKVDFPNDPFQKIQSNFKTFIKPVIDSNKKFDNLYNSQPVSKNNAIKDSLYKIKLSNIKRLLDKKIEFISENANSYFSLYEFSISIVTTSTLYSADELFKIFEKFSTTLKNTSLGKEVLTILMKKKSLLINKEIINFDFISNTNKRYSISQYKDSQYVLLCFWASWCAPCIKNIPMLSDIHKRYSQQGLQLISISIDDDQSKWLDALKKYQMPWLQTCDIKGFINEKELIRDKYYIHAIPQYFLIDKNGLIIYHNFQSKDENHIILLKTLKDIFRNQ